MQLKVFDINCLQDWYVILTMSGAHGEGGGYKSKEFGFILGNIS